MAEARSDRRSLRGAALGRASAVMAAGTAVSRVLGFVRAAVLALVIGGVLTAGGNAFTLANTIPTNLYLLIAGGVLNAVLVPQVVRAMQRPDGGAEYLDRLVTAAVAVLATATLLLTLASPAIVWLFSTESPGEMRPLAIAFAFWCLPQVFFYALYTLLGQILNAKGHFGAYMWAPVVNNVVALAGLGAFVLAFGRVSETTPADAWTPAQIAVLAGSSTLGVVAQALILLVPLRRAGVRLRPRWGVRGMGLRTAGKVAGWTFGALLLSQGTALVVSNVTTSVPDDSGAGNYAWANAFLLFMLPHSLVTVSLVTALFTRMSAAAARGALEELRADVSSAMRTVGVAMVLATAGLIVTADAAGVLLGGGRAQPGRALGAVVAVAALGLVPFSATYLVQRGFYALEDARTPFFVQCLATFLWVSGSLASFLLPPEHRVVGVAASLAVSQWAGALAGLVALHRRLGGVDAARIASTHVRLLVIGALATAAGLLAVRPLDGLLERSYVGAAALAVIGGGVVVLVYGAGLAVLRVEEVRPLLRRLPGPLRRP
ncbi:putative peptidoglycan lipid II flippase [Quadrisphaera granulorum]|uniref:Putative peptidoglycan lipid II flippase n=1 Tax=Quadrisphaera granulorum TaxID=317664 RepID=A0A316ADG0_9ACTN|nr:murein biosynthesis integral membrane protein MurJ [Quadrisphaera granulorum]PWJ55773.1 putative peptidoglycan lipid II flippase [Quadrisphaera granulorum]SZE95270.1 putative peptidoglycan lipid II flippase [Quadrisphaera granulorum]